MSETGEMGKVSDGAGPVKTADAEQPAGWMRTSGMVLTVAYWIAAVALLAWGASRRFALPQWPIIDPDIEGYLGPAISALGGHGFVHITGRSFPYPFFVFLILRIFGDFRAIAVVQHCLGIAAGAVILMGWNAALNLLPPGGVPKALGRWMGLVPMYIYLGSSSAISYEHQIRPEAVFAFLAMVNLWLGFLFLRARFIQPKKSWVWIGALNVFVAFLVYMAKPSFGFATVLTTLPVWISLIVPGRPGRERGVLLAAAILPALLILFIPEHLLKSRDIWGPLFLPETLLTVHANIVVEQMGEDLAGNKPLPEPREMVQAAHDLLATEQQKAVLVTVPKGYPTLGFNPDYLMYDAQSFCIRFQALEHLTNRQMADFCMTWYLRALRGHPGEMAAKWRRQFALFFTAKNPAYYLGKSMDISTGEYARVARLMPLTAALGPGNPAVARYVDVATGLAAKGVTIEQPRRFIEWLRFFSANYIDLLVVALASPLLLIARPLRVHFLWLAAGLWLAYSNNVGNCLTIAIVHTLEVTRYVRIQLIFTVFSQCLSLYLLLELAVYGLRAVLTRTMGDRAGGAR